MLARLTTQATKFWQRQKTSQRIILISIAVVVLILVPVIITWANTPTYTVLYSELAETDAAQIVEKLKTDGISYQMRGTSTILVPSDKVYDVRLSMATAGLPTGGGSGVGFELFSSGNTLGMTEFTQKINYLRALDGELERTISTLDAVQAVRVHVVTPEKTLFSDEQAPTTASVTIQEKTGKHLDAAQVRSITYLVASAVEGLKPESVVVVDANGNMLASGSGDSATAAASTAADGKRAAELTVAADIKKKVQNLIDTALGPNRSVVQASVSLNWTEKQVTTQSFDPTPVAVRSAQTLNENYTTDSTTVGGVPGAGTNLPVSTPGVSTTGEGNLVYSRTEQTNNYEISKTESTETIHPGEIEKVSLSVLVDGVTDAEQLNTLQAAISAAAGIDVDRGDIISVQTLAFDKSAAEEQAKELSDAQRNDYLILGAEILAAILVAAFLFWYINRLLKNLKMASVDIWTPVLKPVSEMEALGSGTQMPTSLPQEFLIPAEETPPLPPMPPIPEIIVKKAEPKVVITPEEEQMQRVVSRLADDNPASVAEIIQLWLNEDKQKGM